MTELSPLSYDFPRLTDKDVFCSVTVLNASSLVLQESHFLLHGTNERVERPSFCFLIRHPTTGENILWDLGIRQEYLKDLPHPSHAVEFASKVPYDLTEALAEVPLAPEDIHKVLLSHKHWDHTGNPAPYTNASFYIGQDDISHVHSLHPNLTNRTIPINFETSLSTPIAAFDNSIDLYNDGSIFLIDANGHTPGHVNLLVHTGPSEWILLASDGCHHKLLLSTDPKDAHRTFGKFKAAHEADDAEPSYTCNEDVAAAERHLERLRACQRREEIMVVIAHNEVQWKSWFGDKKYGAGPALNGWKGKGYKLSAI